MCSIPRVKLRIVENYIVNRTIFYAYSICRAIVIKFWLFCSTHSFILFSFLMSIQIIFFCSVFCWLQSNMQIKITICCRKVCIASVHHVCNIIFNCVPKKHFIACKNWIGNKKIKNWNEQQKMHCKLKFSVFCCFDKSTTNFFYFFLHSNSLFSSFIVVSILYIYLHYTVCVYRI